MRLCDKRKDVISIPAFLHKLNKSASYGVIEKKTVELWWVEYHAIPLAELEIYRDKFLAHQANELSRQRIGNDWNFDVSIIDQCEEGIVKLMHGITMRLLSESILTLPRPDPANWKYRNAPLVPEALNHRMDEIWDEREREVYKWVGVTLR